MNRADTAWLTWWSALIAVGVTLATAILVFGQTAPEPVVTFYAAVVLGSVVAEAALRYVFG